MTKSLAAQSLGNQPIWITDGDCSLGVGGRQSDVELGTAWGVFRIFLLSGNKWDDHYTNISS